MGSSIGSPISVGSFNDLKKTLLISGGIVVNTTRCSKKSLQGSTEVWIIGSNEDAVNMERFLLKALAIRAYTGLLQPSHPLQLTLVAPCHRF